MRTEKQVRADPSAELVRVAKRHCGQWRDDSALNVLDVLLRDPHLPTAKELLQIARVAAAVVERANLVIEAGGALELEAAEVEFVMARRSRAQELQRRAESRLGGVAPFRRRR